MLKLLTPLQRVFVAYTVLIVLACLVFGALRYRSVVQQGDALSGAQTNEQVEALHQRSWQVLVWPAGLILTTLLGGLFFYRASNRSQIRHDERLTQLAHHDDLTGLPNRRMGMDRLQHAMAASLREGKGVGLFFIDLDNFKAVNDTHGHPFGDALICGVRDVYMSVTRPGDTVARQGGDEFLIVLPNLVTIDDLEQVAERIVERFALPLYVEGQELYITASIGISYAPKDTSLPEELMRYADIALYHAKDLGKNRFSFYDEEMNAKAVRRGLVENQLRFAFDRGELSVYYQPQVDVMEDKVSGVEALVRWSNPELGQVSPVEFIPIAEELGLIDQITRTVLNQAIGDIREINRDLDLELSVSINVAARQFRETSLVEMVHELLAAHGLDAKYLTIELTESGLVENFEMAREQLLNLKAMGIGVSIDDFGTGYSSLSYLNRLPITELKIDRSFVRDLCDDEEDRALARSIIALGIGQRIEVVAEGVESLDQVKLLISMGCNTVQGYYFSPPIPIDELRKRLLDNGLTVRANAK